MTDPAVAALVGVGAGTFVPWVLYGVWRVFTAPLRRYAARRACEPLLLTMTDPREPGHG